MVLVVLGAVAGSAAFRQGLEGIIARLRIVFPPGTFSILDNFIARYPRHSWELVLLGLGGTLLAGTQTMKLLMEGFRMVYGDQKPLNFLNLHLRALLLLTATILPSILIVNLVVFGRQVRNRMLHISSMPVLIRLTWSALYIVVSLLIALAVLTVIYRLGKPGHHGLKSHLPGAEVATVLWWVVSISLGFYLRTVPYSLIYGGLAVTIGLMIWMQLTATILLIGAAYNAELLERPD
jgi:membrane protein